MKARIRKLFDEMNKAPVPEFVRTGHPAHREAASVALKADSSKGIVYFIGCDDRFVKIGYTAYHPSRRVSSLNTGSPHTHTLLAFIKGDRNLESTMHRNFALYHHRGEWFRLEGGLKEFVESLQKTGQVLPLRKLKRSKPRLRPHSYTYGEDPVMNAMSRDLFQC